MPRFQSSRLRRGWGHREVIIKIREAPWAVEAQRMHVTLRGVVPGKAVGRQRLRGEAVTKIEEGQELRRGQVA